MIIACSPLKVREVIKKSERYFTARAHADGMALRVFRKKVRGWSQTTLAKKSGVPEGTIATIEVGHRQPSADVLRRLAIALGLDEDGDELLIGHVYGPFEHPCDACQGRGFFTSEPADEAA